MGITPVRLALSLQLDAVLLFAAVPVESADGRERCSYHPAMHLFRDDALLRRAVGASLVFGLLGLWAWHWREDIASRGTYPTGTYDAANSSMHTFWTLAIVAVIYVAACLLLTPRTRTTAEEEPVAAILPEQH